MTSHPITITRTIYDPALKNFVFDSPEEKAMPKIRQWIDSKNPVIYWYILRIDNPSEFLLEQWAVELFTHQALSITDAYIDGIDRRFELKKREHDPWSDKYVLSIPRQLGIPIVGNGTRRIFFKVDVNCREGLMYEYAISGQFIADGVEAVNVREKTFYYSCKVGEFRQIFENNPDEASIYAEKCLSIRYSASSVQVFTNSFRMIHDLYRYCHSSSIERDELLYQLNLLHSNFEKVPEIANKRINPLLIRGIKELSILDGDVNEFKSRYLRLCDSLVELLHIEVVSSNEPQNAPHRENHKTGSVKKESKGKEKEEISKNAKEELERKKLEVIPLSSQNKKSVYISVYTAFKYPFKNPARLLYALLLIIPFPGWIILSGYTVRLVNEFIEGRYEGLIKLKVLEDLKLGTISLVKALPFYFAFIFLIFFAFVISPFLGILFYFLLMFFIIPILMVNFCRKQTVGALFEFELLNAIKDNPGDYIAAVFKQYVLTFAFLVLSIFFIGIPAMYFTNLIFIANFYRRSLEQKNVPAFKTHLNEPSTTKYEIS